MREADPTTLIWTKSFVCLKHVNSDTHARTAHQSVETPCVCFIGAR
jgi:hypothetical protein